jgi:hypothetical protein
MGIHAGARCLIVHGSMAPGGTWATLFRPSLEAAYVFLAPPCLLWRSVGSLAHHRTFANPKRLFPCESVTSSQESLRAAAYTSEYLKCLFDAAPSARDAWR